MSTRKNNWAVTFAFLTTLLTGCGATNGETDYKKVNNNGLASKESRGVKAYQKGNYQRAYDLLVEPAQYGLKGAQYALAFMFLKGQHVEQSTLIGMAWVGVATEVKVKEWQTQYDNLYDSAPTPLKLNIDQKVAEYIEKFGMKAQDVTCQEGISEATKHIRTKCFRGTKITKIYPIELVE